MQARELAVPLESAGARVFVCPLIKIEPCDNDDEVADVLRTIDQYAWIVLTSVNGVECLLDRLASNGISADVLAGKRVACVGPATAAAARRHGLRPHAVPEEHLGEAMPARMAEVGLQPGEKVLLARAQGGGAALPALLRERGAQVTDLALYRTVPDTEGAARLKALVRTDQLDLVTFTSGSAASYFVQTVGTAVKPALAAIGPSTAETARRLGLRIDMMAEPHTIAGLVRVILEYYAARSGSWRSDAGK